MSDKKLTDKERLFVHEYLIDLNAAEAWRRCGYEGPAAKQLGHEVKMRPHVSQAIQDAMDARVKRTDITADYVLTTIKDTIERCRQAEPVMEWNRDTKEMERTGEWKFDANAVLKGCELLGKNQKLWTDKVEHSGKVTLAELVAGADDEKKETE